MKAVELAVPHLLLPVAGEVRLNWSNWQWKWRNRE